MRYFLSFKEKTTIKGLVIKNISNSFTVRSDQGDFDCLAQGKLKQDGKVLVGDRVEFDILKGNFGCITKVEPRHNSLVRPPIANVDNLIIVFATEPQPDYVLIDKLVLMCMNTDIKPIICINKSDLITEQDLAKIHSYYDQVVLDIVTISAKNKHNFFIDITSLILKIRLKDFQQEFSC